MLVGHTHDDIDALFRRWSKENFSTIPSLMKSLMDVDSVPTIPHLIEEVPDFKAFIECSLLEGEEALVGHIKAQQFKFFLNSMGILVMKYRHYCIDSDWLPEEGGGIKLWREDAKKQSQWPCGELVPIVHLPMHSMDDITRVYPTSSSIGRHYVTKTKVERIEGGSSIWCSIGRQSMQL